MIYSNQKRSSAWQVAKSRGIQSLDKNQLHFLPLCVLCVLLLSVSGCSMISGSRGGIRITSWRCLWKSEAIVFSVVDSNLVASLSVGKSATDGEAVAAVTAAAVSAAMKSVVPIP